MGRFRLVDLIKLSGVTLDGTAKLHLATEHFEDPLEKYFEGSFKEYQEQQRKRNFKSDIVSLVRIGQAEDNRWLFVGVFSVIRVAAGEYKGEKNWKYETEEVDGLDHMVGRTIVSFVRPGRNAYLMLEKYADQLEVVSMEEDKVTEAYCRL